MLFWTIAATVAVPTAAAQKPFEGTIVYDVLSGDRQMQMTVTTRGRKVRRDLAMPDAPEVSRGNYQIIDFSSGDATVVIPAMKRYMVMRVGGLRSGTPEASLDPGRMSSQRAAARQSPARVAPSS